MTSRCAAATFYATVLVDAATGRAIDIMAGDIPP